MLNQVVLVGRLTDDPQVITTENGKKFQPLSLLFKELLKTKMVYMKQTSYDVFFGML